MEKESRISQTMLWVRMAVTFNLLYQEIKKDLAKENLTVSQLDILVCLDRTKGLPLSEVADRLLVTGGNVTGIIDRLENAGFVTRQRDSKDRRIVWARLTEKGYGIYRQLMPRYIETMNRINSYLTPAERKELMRMLKKLSTGAHKKNSNTKQ
ncbi:MAG: MarR family transcriptional regulator [Proteobacteria bacterium]|nr:MarR family transcriptional regulator [Pseudomonadota bacterium]